MQKSNGFRSGDLGDHSLGNFKLHTRLSPNSSARKSVTTLENRIYNLKFVLKYKIRKKKSLPCGVATCTILLPYEDIEIWSGSQDGENLISEMTENSMKKIKN